MTQRAASLDAHLARVAAAPRLVVAVDFDGTIAPIEPRPWMVVPEPRAVDALTELAGAPGTTVAVVSARSLGDLARQLGRPRGVRLVGSYGAEDDGPVGLTDAEARRWARLAVAFERLAVEHESAWVERKALGVAFHTRGVPDSAGLLARALAAATEVPGAHVMPGSEVVEALVRPVSKASAVEALVQRTTADAVVYVGDDHADEAVFAALGAADLGVHVGGGPTAAAWSLPDPAAAGALLARLAHLRTSLASVGTAREDLHHAR